MKSSIKNIETKRRFPLFGKEVEIILYDIEESFAELFLNDINKEGQRLQKIFNFYDEKSELSVLNKKRKMRVSDDLSFVISRALDYCMLTGGIYDISKGVEFLARKKGEEVKKASCSYKDIFVDENNIELKNVDVLIDLGSIAKGYIVDRLIDFAGELGIESIYIDARGDIRISGSHSENVMVQHPRDKAKKLCSIRLKDMSVATSGDYSQYFGSYKNSHIVGQDEIISATVVAGTLMEADAFATVFCLLSKKESEDILIKKAEIKAYLIDKDLKEYYYNGFAMPKVE